MYETYTTKKKPLHWFFILSFVVFGLSLLLLFVNLLWIKLNLLFFNFLVTLLGVSGFILFYTFIHNNKNKMNNWITIGIFVGVFIILGILYLILNGVKLW
jgi:uncharacterized BrkB/YihY/UPF0761 family membrane protein